MPNPLTGYAPAQLLNGLYTDQQQYGPAPDWTDQETWDRANAEAQRLISDPSATIQGGNGIQRTLQIARSGGDPTQLINAIAAQQTPGGQFGNSELANGLVNAGIIGTGIGSAFANLGGAAGGYGSDTVSSSFTNAGQAGGLVGQGGQDMAALYGGGQAGQDMAAVIAGGGGGAGAASGLGGLGLGGWLTVGALGAQALQGNKDITTNSTNAPPAYIAPYLQDAAGQASNLYGQGNYVAPIQQSAIDYGTNVLSGNYLNSNPWLDATFNKAAGAVTNQVQSNFGLSGRNPRGIDAAGFAQEGYNDLATQIYGGNYQAERQRQQQLVPYAGQLGSYTNPGQSLDDYIARLRNLSGGYGTQTSTTPTQSNWANGLAGLGLAMMGG